jgi:5'-3' exoribonuclease 2
MDQLAVCLRYYITNRLNNDPGWKDIQVVLSDSSVPGEGEHKIMDYIRRHKINRHYGPNTKHVLYGLDADLIMLALATHEPNFWILREDVNFKGKIRPCDICGHSTHPTNQCTGKPSDDELIKYMQQKPFLFVHISVLREYLETEMKLYDVPFEWDLERAIDDWVFLCFFVGNDFLPHLPSLEIREGAIEKLITIWKSKAREWNGYLTDSGEISMARVQSVLEELGEIEDGVFRNRREEEEKKRMARLERKQSMKDRKNGNQNRNKESVRQEQMKNVESFSVKEWSEMTSGRKRNPGNDPRDEEVKKPRLDEAGQKPFSHRTASSTSNYDAAKKLKMQILNKLPGAVTRKEDQPASAIFSMDDFGTSGVANDNVEVEEVIEEASFVAPQDRQSSTKSSLVIEKDSKGFEGETPDDSETADSTDVFMEKDSDEEAPLDDVRLWESGWKARYYEKKFNVDVGDEEFRSK